MLDLLLPPRLEQIYADTERDYCWSNEWTPEFFVAQAKAALLLGACRTYLIRQESF